MTAARGDALAAGDAYASLGNAEGVAAADQVVTGIDDRIQRLVFVLSALVIVLGAWLAVWLWQRAPARLKWQSARVPARVRRAARAGGN